MKSAIEQEMEELQKQLEAATDETANEEQDDVAEVVEVEPTVKPEEPKEEPKPEEAKQEDPDARGFARLRREAKAAEQRAEAEAARVRELEERLKAKDEPQVREEAAIPAELRELIEDHTLSRAERELQSYEAAARAANPDYDAVASAYANEIFKSIRTLNPDKSQIEVMDMTKRKVLETAAHYLNKGHENPAEEMYHRAKEIGFKPEPKQEITKEEKKEPKPDMAKVAANRARSAGLAAATGESRGDPSPTYVATNYTAAEIAKMPEADFQAMMRKLS